MTLEDAALMDADEKDLHDELDSAVQRMSTHVSLEAQRSKAGLRTDLERWMATGEAAD